MNFVKFTAKLLHSVNDGYGHSINQLKYIIATTTRWTKDSFEMKNVHLILSSSLKTWLYATLD